MIPGSIATFPSALGSTDRPFASPNDPVEIALRSCDERVPPFTDGSGFAAAPTSYVVTVLFTPPNGAARHAVVLTNASDCEAQLPSCAEAAAAGTSTCCVAAAGIAVVSREGEQHLSFQFPNTAMLVPHPAPGRTLAGPAMIAVTAAGAPRPALTTSSCTATSGLLACVDRFYADGARCGTAAPAGTFPHFTALPPPNDYHALCVTPNPPCTGSETNLRFAIDADGNILLPMDWRGVQVSWDTVPVPRLLRASSMIEAFPGSAQPIRIPEPADLGLASGDTFLGSYAQNGRKLQPIFDPQRDPDATEDVTLFGSADAPATILRIARRSPVGLVCVGGESAGQPCIDPAACPGGTCGVHVCAGNVAPADEGKVCASDADCPGGACREGLFDFHDRLVDGVGAVEVGDLDAVALDPVPLDGLVQSAAANVFVGNEAIRARELPDALKLHADRNGDCDLDDDIATLADRKTGVGQVLGPPAECDFPPASQCGTPEGRAIVRVQVPPFSFPAVAADGDVVAFLESEPGENGCDETHDGDVFDGVLRVFRLGGAEALMSPLRAADAAPLIDGRSLAVSGGRRVFCRTSEAATARQQTSIVSVTPAGAAGGAPSRVAAISADGRFVAFESIAGDLVADDHNGTYDIFVRDREANTTTRVSVTTSGDEGVNGAFHARISANGRFVTFLSDSKLSDDDANTEVADIFVRDRDTDGNGIFDEAGGVSTTLISVGVNGQGPSSSDLPQISADGRYVAFRSDNPLVAQDLNQLGDIFVGGREGGPLVRVSGKPDGSDTNGVSQDSALSADGRFVAFDSVASDLAPSDTNRDFDIFVRDRDADGNGVFDEPGAVATTRVSVDSAGVEANDGSIVPTISADGRFVSFTSIASNLVPGDTNGAFDIFVHDRDADGDGIFDEPDGMATTRVSLASSGAQANGSSFAPSLSADGRYVAFRSDATNLVAGDTNGVIDVFVHDRLTGHTQRVSVSSDGAEANSDSQSEIRPAMSGDGRFVAFHSDATNLVAADGNGVTDVFVRGPDPSDSASDLFADGKLDDTVLEVLDAGAGAGSNGPLTLCPAEQVAIAGDVATFLRRESDAGTATCPGGSLNPPDTDTDDQVVQLWRAGGGGVENLGRAATAVVVSPAFVAALTSEAGDGADYNDDLDMTDTVVQVHATQGGDWANVRQAADSLAISGSVVAFDTPESAQGNGMLNADSDHDDRVLQVYDAAGGGLLLGRDTTPQTEAAEDFVIGGIPGGEIVAFRTREARQGDGGDDLNEDGDRTDDVLQVFDVANKAVVSTRLAVRPCRLEACDPRLPYRVGRNTVTFLTLECDQRGTNTHGCAHADGSGGQDLNGDGDAGDLVLQVFNVRQASTAAQNLAAGRGVLQSPTEFARTLASVSAGVCTTTADACAMDDNCGPGGTCFIPPGGCIKDLGTRCCVPRSGNAGTCDLPGGSGACGANAFCDPIPGSPGNGICKQAVGNCTSDADCSVFDECTGANPACLCNDAALAIQRLVSPLAAPEGGGHVFTSAGRCVEDLGTSCSTNGDCAVPAFCGPAGTCVRTHGTCRKQTDCPCPDPASCPTTFTCEPALVVATDADSDGDEVPDRVDNCPTVANPDQGDADTDGIGDACERAAACGNGVQDAGEECDDGNLQDGDGCSSDCRLGCAQRPVLGCKQPAGDRPGVLALRSHPSTSSADDKLRWEWRGDASTSDFGDPVHSDAYTLCIYDASGLIAHAVAPPGGACDGTEPCWNSGTRGFRYHDPELTPDGLSHVVLQASRDGDARIRVRGRGPRLALPDDLLFTSSLHVQLSNGHGACWEATYSPPFANSGTHLFRAIAD